MTELSALYEEGMLKIPIAGLEQRSQEGNPHQCQGRQRHGAEGPTHIDGVPELCALFAHVQKQGLLAEIGGGNVERDIRGGSNKRQKPCRSRRCPDAMRAHSA